MQTGACLTKYALPLQPLHHPLSYPLSHILLHVTALCTPQLAPSYLTLRHHFTAQLQIDQIPDHNPLPCPPPHLLLPAPPVLRTHCSQFPPLQYQLPHPPFPKIHLSSFCLCLLGGPFVLNAPPPATTFCHAHPPLPVQLFRLLPPDPTLTAMHPHAHGGGV